MIGYMSLVGDTSKYNREQITTVLVEAITRACERDVFINDNIDIIYLEKDKGGRNENKNIR